MLCWCVSRRRPESADPVRVRVHHVGLAPGVANRLERHITSLLSGTMSGVRSKRSSYLSIATGKFATVTLAKSTSIVTPAVWHAESLIRFSTARPHPATGQMRDGTRAPDRALVRPRTRAYIPALPADRTAPLRRSGGTYPCSECLLGCPPGAALWGCVLEPASEGKIGCSSGSDQEARDDLQIDRCERALDLLPRSWQPGCAYLASPSRISVLLSDV
jgi:hypothetical protein